MKNCTALDPIEFLDDYCPTCCPAGHDADRCDREASLTEPDAVEWRGGRWVICTYTCGTCDHTWTRSDLWDAASAGFTTAGRAA